ncbi:hypothetical protein BH11GEM2_BH11GEM2_14920 [soil metagenome]
MNKRIRRKQIRKLLLIELAAQFADPADAVAWLETPIDTLEGRTPRQAITEGEIERVTLMLDALNSRGS